MTAFETRTPNNARSLTQMDEPQRVMLQKHSASLGQHRAERHGELGRICGACIFGCRRVSLVGPQGRRSGSWKARWAAGLAI